LVYVGEKIWFGLVVGGLALILGERLGNQTKITVSISLG
jgi:hypothetical protein